MLHFTKKGDETEIKSIKNKKEGGAKREKKT
jgi:hypothetical protein